ncbi:MAG: phosphatase [Chloroflexota bacterium]
MNQSDGADAAAERRELIRRLNPLGRIRLRIAARLHEYASDLARGNLNLSWITDDLAAGGSVRVRDYFRLRDHGITGVIDLRAEGCDDADGLRRMGIDLLHLPTPDRYAPSNETLLTGVSWTRERLGNGGKVFAHCEHGVGRGPLMICSVLVSTGVAGPDALAMVRERRWQSAPNDRQLESLLSFETYWRGLTETGVIASPTQAKTASATNGC